VKYSSLLNFCIRTIIAVVVISATVSQARAEYVFKKDGAIIEGKIIAEGGTSITIMTLDKKRQTFQRKDIMRVLYTKLYMGKVFIRMTTGETQEGYVVDEDQDNYFVRKDITKPEEITIQRVKVMFIARSNPTDLIGAATQHEITLKWSAPYIPGKKYRVYIKGPKETEFAKPIEISGTSYTISKLKSNSAFRVYITSVDGEGIESLPSEHIEVTTLNIPPTAPGEIQKETVENSDPTKAGLNMKWAPSIDADGEIVEYRVYKDTTEGTELKLGTTKK
jgi:hypothetical protein